MDLGFFYAYFLYCFHSGCLSTSGDHSVCVTEVSTFLSALPVNLQQEAVSSERCFKG